MRLNQTEDQLCKAFAKYVQYRVNTGELDHFDVIHINNGERGGNELSRTIAGRRAKEMGQKTGVADYLVCGRHFLEAKAKGKYQEPEQKEFEAYCKSIGARYHVFRDAEEGLRLVLEIKREEIYAV